MRSGIVLIVTAFVLPTFHGVMEFYINGGSYIKLKELSLFTGAIVTPLTVIAVYLYGIGFIGLRRKPSVLTPKRQGERFSPKEWAISSSLSRQ